MKLKGFIISGAIVFGIGLILWLIVILQPGFKYSDAKFPVEEVSNKYDEVLNVYYEGDADDIEIISTTAEDEIITYNSEAMWYEVSYDETSKTVRINQKTKDFIFDISINNSRVGKPIVIKINGELNKLHLEVDAGDVTIKDLTVDKLELNIDAGKASFINCVTNQAELEIDAGSLDYEGKVFDYMEVSIDVGSIEIDLAQKRSEFNINGVGSGSIRLILDTELGSKDVDFID